jgi:16S rRNA processing protein RimM
MEPQTGRVCIGKILKPVGLKGFLKIQSYTHPQSNLLTLSPILDDKGQSLMVTKISSKNDEMVVAIRGVDTRTLAETWCGNHLYVDRVTLPSLSTNEFYHIDLIGLKVIDTHGMYRGIVIGVHNYGGGDILEIEHLNKTIMIPFAAWSVLEVTPQHITVSAEVLE